MFGYDLSELSGMQFSQLLNAGTVEEGLFGTNAYRMPRNLVGKQKVPNVFVLESSRLHISLQNGSLFPMSLITSAAEEYGMCAVRIEKYVTLLSLS